MQIASSHTAAVYTFSADPITYGHINIIERVASSFPRCVVGVGRNPTKRYLFSAAERLHLVKQSLSHLPHITVRGFAGMAVDFAFEQGASVLIKGVRSATDVEYEQTLHQVGVSQQMGVDTHLLFADPRLAHVSSSVVKAMQMEHGFIQEYVPPAVKAALEAKVSQQLLIGVTGDIAAGKSTLAADLVSAGKKVGVPVHNIDLDSLSHAVLSGQGTGKRRHRELLSALRARFGCVTKNERVDRQVLAKRVFSCSRDRAFLTSLMLQPLSACLRRALQGKSGVILLNGALLPDMELLGLCNYRCILCEVAPEEQARRLGLRGMGREQITKRRSAQLRGEQKAERIGNAIATHHFGHLWPYRGEPAVDFLQGVLETCEEFVWMH